MMWSGPRNRNVTECKELAPQVSGILCNLPSFKKNTWYDTFSFFLNLCMNVAYMCGACAHVYAHKPMKTRRLGGLCHSLPPCSFDTVPLWAWTWPGSQLTPSGDPLPSHSTALGWEAWVLGGSWGANSGPHASAANALTCRIISPALQTFSWEKNYHSAPIWKWFASRDAVYVWLWSTGCRNPSSAATLCGGTLMSWERQPRRPRFAHRMAISIGSTWSVLGLILCWVR